MKDIIVIAIGGALGAILRFYVVDWLMSKGQFLFPYGTLAVNMIGSLLIGLLVGFYMTKPDVPEWLWGLLVIGGLGAFTTFSTFALDSLQLLNGGKYLYAAVYVGTHLVGGIVLCALGVLLGRMI